MLGDCVLGSQPDKGKLAALEKYWLTIWLKLRYTGRRRRGWLIRPGWYALRVEQPSSRAKPVIIVIGGPAFIAILLRRLARRRVHIAVVLHMLPRLRHGDESGGAGCLGKFEFCRSW
jgi:hypothetical protein